MPYVLTMNKQGEKCLESVDFVREKDHTSFSVDCDKKDPSLDIQTGIELNSTDVLCEESIIDLDDEEWDIGKDLLGNGPLEHFEIKMDQEESDECEEESNEKEESEANGKIVQKLREEKKKLIEEKSHVLIQNERLEASILEKTQALQSLQEQYDLKCAKFEESKEKFEFTILECREVMKEDKETLKSIRSDLDKERAVNVDERERFQREREFIIDRLDAVKTQWLQQLNSKEEQWTHKIEYMANILATREELHKTELDMLHRRTKTWEENRKQEDKKRKEEEKKRVAEEEDRTRKEEERGREAKEWDRIRKEMEMKLIEEERKR
ncbi:hypothetical protein ADUPG1_009825, partial [Aduncisulcus paluster]